MRRVFVPLLVGTACLLAPLAAFAQQDYTPVIRNSKFVPLDKTDPRVVHHVNTQNVGVSDLETPFPILYYGQAFNYVNISVFGYMTFSPRPGLDNKSGGVSYPGVSGNQAIPNSGTYPDGVLAAWWDQVDCNRDANPSSDSYGNGIYTLATEIEGKNTFTVEWRCYNTVRSAKFEMQARFTEYSPIIQVFYGSFTVGSTTPSATIGLESPPIWRVDGSGVWSLESTGATAYARPTFENNSCNGNCGASVWPKDQVIQYGLPDLPDLQAGINATTGFFGLKMLSLTGVGNIQIELENNIENGGRYDAENVSWDYYLVPDGATFDPSDGTLPRCSHTNPETIEGLRIRTFEDNCFFDVDPDTYRICTVLDPPSEAAPGGAVNEASELNNRYCTDPFLVGTDLTGSLILPGSAEAGATMKVPVVVENRGLYPADDFTVQIWLQDCARSPTDTTGNSLVWETVLRLQGSGPDRIWEKEVSVPVPADIKGTTICGILAIDSNDDVDELDEANNSYSTCGIGDVPYFCAKLSLPDLFIEQLSTNFPRGCFYGEQIEIAARLCNKGLAEARGFGLAFYIDDSAVPTISDTMVVSVPQACIAKSECSGDADCIGGLCHAPCQRDSDCGSSGLVCRSRLGSSDLTCQLALFGETCQDVRVRADLPLFIARDGAPFRDGDAFVSAIVDFNEILAEAVEGVENTFVLEATACWTRNPDFTPVELRTLPSLAAGEVIPVFRRVRNLGVVSGDYKYRYFLSSNETISESDIGLEIEGIDGGRLLGEASVGARADDVGNDLVRLPVGIVPGYYYLGIVIDPGNEVTELREGNNTASTERLTVVDSSFRVVTASLRTVTVGASYAVQLLAVGGGGASTYSWSVTDGALPQGLQLEPNGLLQGTPGKVGTYLFGVTVASGSNTASALLALEVAEARGPLAITLGELPPAFQGVEYRVLLGASGGRPPYHWKCLTKPGWLELTNNYLWGTSNTAAGPAPVTCSITDENGTMVSKDYSVAVYSAASIRIQWKELSPADVGETMTGCFAAEGGSGTYTWAIDTASVPPGVGFENRSNTGCFVGAPEACGTFLVGVTATDVTSGLTDTRQFALTVSCPDIRLTSRSFPAAERNAEYPVTRLTTTSLSSVVFEIASGELPLGLTLSADGEISGTVDEHARPGAHNLAVRLRDELGGSGVGAIAIHVLPDPVSDVTITKTKKTGCSTSAENSVAGLLPFAAAFALLGLRRRNPARPAAAGLVAAAILFPSVASAQLTPGYATYQRPKTYERLVGATPLPATSLNMSHQIVLEDWTVPFFGQKYASLRVHENGLILFGAHVPATPPYPIPFVIGSSARLYIAGWWDEHDLRDRADSWLWEQRGTAPNRELVFEWNWRTAVANDDPDDGGEHQISIFENGDIAIRWGSIAYSGMSTASHRAVIGLLDSLGSDRSVPFLSCSAYSGSNQARCTSDDWNKFLKNTEAVFTTLPNLQVRATATAIEGLSGLEQHFEATVYNYGAYSTPATVRFFVSADAELSADDVPVGTSDAITVGPFAEAKAYLTAPLPVQLDDGWYYLLAVADPDAIVAEFVEEDNVGGAFEFRVAPALPDLEVTAFRAPASGTPGSTITVDLEVRNLGNANAVDFPFWVVLSDNDVITISDIPVYRGTISAAWLQTAETSVVATLPANTPPNSYRIGVILDPEGKKAETNRVNNTAGADRPFLVTAEGLVVTTLAPRTIQVGSELCIPLQAEGGDGVYTWSHTEGTLPPGLELISGGATDDAALCGRPTAIGIFDFVLQVVSGNLSAKTEMTLEVTRDALGLSISGRDLPMARFRVPYETGLTAFGGAVPYTWTLVSGELPTGLSMHEDGLIFGTPLEAKRFDLTVRVTDSAGEDDEAAVTLVVAPPSRVTCASQTLGTLEVGEPFTGRLLAAGGDEGKYQWTTRSTYRIGDAGGLPFDGEKPPPGLILSQSSGEVAGTPSQVGRYIWAVDVAVAGTTQIDTCQLTVDVVGGQGLSIITTALPSAVPDVAYRAVLQAIGGTNLTWSLAEGSSLPGDMVLGSNGVLSWTPTSNDLGENLSRTFGFRVQVRDQQNRQGTGSFSVTLAPEPSGTATVVERTEDGGCQAAGGGFGLAALALVVVTLWRRR